MKPIDVKTLQSWIARDACVLVDIREPNETALERIAGSKLLPLSSITPQDLTGLDGKTIVYHCKGGARTQQNASLLASCANGCEAFYLEGGIEGWKKAGLPVKR